MGNPAIAHYIVKEVSRMNKILEYAGKAADKAADIALECTIKILETSAKGLVLLSSIIKGDKKISVKVEEVK